MLHWNCPRLSEQFRFIAGLAILFLFASLTFAQTGVSTGNVIGLITDQNGTTLVGARVTITRIDKNQSIELRTNGSGFYNSGPLVPGEYSVQISAKGFNSVRQPVTVEVDNAALVSAKLANGDESKVIQLPALDSHLHTEQATVQYLLIRSEMEDLPINGRDPFDIAQLEPGVQLADAAGIAGTKAGYTWISLGGRVGRTTRMEVDGSDVSDETYGTTTTVIPWSSIQEFQISQSMSDLPTELTASGAINMSTLSGGNSVHGEAFGQFRDSSVLAARLPVPQGVSAPFQRTQYGGNVGGPLIKDKAFIFLDGERTLQYINQAVPLAYPFQQYSGAFENPFRQDNLLGRLDYMFPHDVRAFYRFSYFKNFLSADGGMGYSAYDNKNISRDHVLGLDFARGRYTHSLRFSYLKFENQVADAPLSSNLPFGNLGAQIFMGSTGLSSGPNYLAPQSTSQSNLQIKYDGGRVLGTHSFRFGVAYDRIQAASYAPNYLNGAFIASQTSLNEESVAAGGPFANGAANPLNYPADNIIISNGQGYSTSATALGFPAGGFGPDNRILLYFGDSWKASPTFTLTYGIRYNRDTARTDSQFPAIPQLNNLFPALGNAVRQPNLNFAPQFGFAWDPNGNGKTSVRGGIGLFYEDSIWNDLRYDASLRASTGTYFQPVSPCAAPGVPNILQTASGPINLPGSATANAICGTGAGGYPLIGNVLPSVMALQQQWAANTPFSLHGANPNYVGANLAGCNILPSSPNYPGCYFLPGASMLNPNYQSPRSLQMNLGIQHELRPGAVLTVDVVRSVESHYLLGIDQNHSGDVRYFNPVGAADAVATTLAACGANSVGASWSANCPFDPRNGTTDGGTWGTAANPARPANIGDYARFGLGSSTDMGGSSCPAGIAAALAATGNPTLINKFPNGYPCAFGGLNPNSPPINLLSPVGRSVYTALQAKLVETLTKHPLPWTKTVNMQIAYTLSRFDDSGSAVPNDAPVTAFSSSDENFAQPALDNVNPNRYFGPGALDRTHLVSFGAVADMRSHFQVGVMLHFYSPLSATPTVPYTGLGAGEIFRTDFTGDGNVQNPIPGTHVGSFMHGIDNSSIHSVISSFNANVAGQPTPAGHQLVQTNLLPDGVADLVGLGAVANGGNPIPAEPSGQVNMSWLKTLDASVGWTHTFFDRVTVKPSIGVFNVLNFANFDLPGNMMSGLLTGTPGTINGTTYGTHVLNRAGLGPGLFSLGSPREAEFKLKIEF